MSTGSSNRADTGGDGGDWEELFAMASANPSSTQPAPFAYEINGSSASHESSSTAHPSSCRDQNNKHHSSSLHHATPSGTFKSGGNSSISSSQNHHQCFLLQDRCCNHVTVSSRLGSGFWPRPKNAPSIISQNASTVAVGLPVQGCPRWTATRDNSKNNKTSESISRDCAQHRRQYQLPCVFCQQPPGAHRLWHSEPRKRAKQQQHSASLPPVFPAELALELYTSVRNIRCFCRFVLEFLSLSSSLVSSSRRPQDFPNKDDDSGDCSVPKGCHNATMTELHATLHTALKNWNHDHISSNRCSWHVTIDTVAQELCNTFCPDAIALAVESLDMPRTKATPERSNRHINNDNRPRLSYTCFDWLVRTIIACDAVYYQLYYAQIISTPHATVTTGKDEPCSWCKYQQKQQQTMNDEMTGNGSSPCVKTATVSSTGSFPTKDNSIPISENMIPHPISHFGEWETSTKQGSSHGSKSSKNENALATLHRLRLAETKAIFENWVVRYPSIAETFLPDDSQPSSDRSRRRPNKRKRATTSKSLLTADTDSSSSSWEDLHSTLAPPLLTAWRDSCRDFLCHLYSYATLSNSTVWQLCHTLRAQTPPCTRIVEVGAGTGYMAHLLSSTIDSAATTAVQTTSSSSCASTNHPTALVVTATDSTPDASNEYHAATPSYVTVHRGDATRQSFWTQPSVWNPNKSVTTCSTGSTSSSATALLLCYPPPQSDMAVLVLRQFCGEWNGRIVIHIGEFQGMTGNSDFEEDLLEHFSCLERWPCLSWGTDTAAVTIWQRRHSPRVVSSNESFLHNRGSSLLLPCSNCNRKESIRRCRMLRSLTYCCMDCFKAHAACRCKEIAQIIFAGIQALPILEFDNRRHFNRLFSK